MSGSPSCPPAHPSCAVVVGPLVRVAQAAKGLADGFKRLLCVEGWALVGVQLQGQLGGGGGEQERGFRGPRGGFRVKAMPAFVRVELQGQLGRERVQALNPKP